MTLWSGRGTSGRRRVPCLCHMCYGVRNAAGCALRRAHGGHQIRNTQICAHAVHQRPIRHTSVHVLRRQLPEGTSLQPTNTNPSQKCKPLRRFSLKILAHLILATSTVLCSRSPARVLIESEVATPVLPERQLLLQQRKLEPTLLRGGAQA